MATETFTTPGTDTWVCPVGVTDIQVECWGAGGGGHSAGGATAGGAGGAYVKRINIAVIPGTSYDIVVGTGGTPGVSGTDSYFDTGVDTKAKGGISSNTSPLATENNISIGDTRFKGGNGNTGDSKNDDGGGGGSSGGTSANGNNASGSTGGTAPTGGGAGGNGATLANSNGVNGSTPGGGGGGKTGSGTAGTGADGKVIINYSDPASGYIVESFHANNTWVCPASVTEVQVECWGGGGGGRGGDVKDTGHGGGGGAYALETALSVTPSSSYTVTVGAGGAGGTGLSGSGSNGNDSWFSTSGTVLAKAGVGATASAGTGGSSGSCIGDTVRSGGNGGNFDGGGSGSGSAAGGNNGSTDPGSSLLGGGAGGRQYGTVSATHQAGGTTGVSQNGFIPGGGGGGGSVTSPRTAGNGAAGRVRLTYLRPPEAVNNTLSLSHVESHLTDYVRSVSDTLTLTDDADGATLSVSADNTLTLTQSAINIYQASNTLTITDVAHNIYQASNTLSITDIGDTSIPIIQTITFTQDATGIQNLNRTVAQTFTISDTYIVVPMHQYISQTLSLTQIGYSALYQRDIAQTLTFSQSVSQFTLTKSASDSLTFSHNVTYANSSQFIDHTLTLSDSVIQNIKIQSVSDTYIITQLAEERSIYASVENTLELEQFYSSNFNHLPDTLTITQEVDVHNAITYISVSNELLLLDDITTGGAIFNLSLEDTLELEQVLQKINEQTLSNTLTFTQSASGIITLKNTLTLTDSVDFQLTKSGNNTLTLTQTVTPNVIRNYTITDTLTLGQSAIYLDLHPDLCQYAPLGTLPAAPSLVTQDFVIFKYPISSPTSIVTLRKPIFDNSQKNSYTKIVRETRGGTLKVYRDDTWTKSKILTYTFNNLKRQEAKDLLDFIETSLGKEVTLIDFEGREWEGLIINPDTALVHESKNNRTITIEFEGTLTGDGGDDFLATEPGPYLTLEDTDLIQLES